MALPNMDSHSPAALVARGTLPAGAFASGHDAMTAFAGTVRDARLRLEAAGADIARLAPAIRALRRIESFVSRPLRLALLGEFNTGKSTLANLILGNAALPTLQISNTRIPTLIHHHPEPVVAVALRDSTFQTLTARTVRTPSDTLRIHVGLPLPHLLACEIVDFPGFSDPWLSYGIVDISRHPVDAVIWCTFSTQSWKQSESIAWHILPARIRRHAMLAVTSADLLAGDQTAKVMARLRRAASGDFQEFAMLSSAQARQALSDRGEVDDPELWRASGAEAFYGSVQRLLSALRQSRLERARALTSTVAGSALEFLAPDIPAGQ
jgi:hypothetical protein